MTNMSYPLQSRVTADPPNSAAALGQSEIVMTSINFGHDYSRLIRHLLWPFCLLTSMGILALGFSRGTETLYFNLSYLWIIACLLLCERLFTYRTDWAQSDGQTGPNIYHTLLNKGLVQVAIVVGISTGLIATQEDNLLSDWPLPVQILVGLVSSEFGLYWAHRCSHEYPFLWRFHSVHHSVKKLWIVNTGRFHFVDSAVSVFGGLPFLILCGISTDAIVWVSAITAYIGILTHCNADMRCGVLNKVFNTPELHRWHHSIESRIGNNNYGENLMAWDQIFGTYYTRKNAVVGTIGINEKMPTTFSKQLLVPFIWQRYQESGGATDAE